MVAVRLPVWSVLSSTPVTVTVWAMFQLPVVKVKVAGFTVAAAISEATTISTLADGRVSSTTV